jgi:hypothetical protein
MKGMERLKALKGVTLTAGAASRGTEDDPQT